MLRIRGSYAFGVISRPIWQTVCSLQGQSADHWKERERKAFIASDVPATWIRPEEFIISAILKLRSLSDEIHFYNIDREEIEKDVVEIQWMQLLLRRAAMSTLC